MIAKQFIVATFALLMSGYCVLANLTVPATANAQKNIQDSVATLNNTVTRLQQTTSHYNTQYNMKLQSLHKRIDVLGIMMESRRNIITKAKYKTCEDMRRARPSLSSEYYWIDPDGWKIGDDPIYVYCDMTHGITSIPHHSEMQMQATPCPAPGCYSREVNYYATMKQLKTLIELSSKCSQSIKVECNYVPLVNNGVTLAWWNDRNGKNQTIWTGSNSTTHTCQCGIDGNCIDPAFLCNCDSVKGQDLLDEGVISNKTLLPITQLNFGHTHYVGNITRAFARHTLGPLNCSGGQSALDPLPIPSVDSDLPRSCQDLHLMGHRLSGFYSVKEEDSIETVYCNFTSSNQGDPEFSPVIVLYQWTVIAIILILLIMIVLIAILIVKVRNLEQQKIFNIHNLSIS